MNGCKSRFFGRIKDALFASAIVVLGLFVSQKDNRPETDQIVRARGIIIEDENGKERILIGAPVPFAENRVRTDSARIRETWGKRLGGDTYMNWYKDYDHNVNGILILDEEGWDRVAIGNPVTDPIIGKRIGPSTGMIVNNSEGLERTGYGIVPVDGKDRVVLGLDKGGRESVALSVMPDGTAGIDVNSSDGEAIFIGRAAEGDWRSPDGESFNGISMKDKDGNERQITTRKE